MNTFFNELKKRKVFRTTTAYAVVAFVIMQLVEIVFPMFEIPNWAGRLVIILLLIGLPITIILSWMFDTTPDGIKREKKYGSEQLALSVSEIALKNDKRSIPLKKRTWYVFFSFLLVLFIGYNAIKKFSRIAFIKSENLSLAVISFQNLSESDDESRIGQILQELIITDLSDIPVLKVFSSQRLFDVQKQLGLMNSRTIDPSLALDVARKVGASTMLTGNIIDIKEDKVLTSRLLKVNDGSVIKSREVKGKDIYATVDDLTVLIREDLNLDLGIESDAAVKNKTTQSIEAYKYYLAGVDLLNESQYSEAIASLKIAIAIDSTFNEAIYSLAIAEWWDKGFETNLESGSGKANKYLRRILNNPQGLSVKDQAKVEGTLLMVNQKWPQALATFEQLVQAYPDEKELWYNLGECYFHGSSNRLKALDAFERSLELDPEYTLAYRHIFDIYKIEKMFDRTITVAKKFNEKYPESSKGYLAIGWAYLAKGIPEKAKENYSIAKNRNPDDISIDIELANMLRLMEEYDQAIQTIESILNIASDRQRAQLMELLSSMRAEQEQYSLAMRTLGMALSLTPIEEINKRASILIGMSSNAYWKNDLPAVHKYLDQIRDDSLGIDQLLTKMIWSGMTYYNQRNSIELSRIINESIILINRASYNGELKSVPLFLQALRYYINGDLDRAVLELNKFADSDQFWYEISMRYLGDIYIKQGLPEKAFNIGKTMLSPTINKDIYHFVHPYGYYLRGVALEAMGKTTEARKNYEHLLRIWMEADSTIPELIDTKSRLSKLSEAS